MKNNKLLAVAILVIIHFSIGKIQAGSFMFANESNGINIITHPVEHGDISENIATIGVCIDPASNNARDMEIPIQNIINTMNALHPVIGNLIDRKAAGMPISTFDFESIALHEMGHCLGLNHPNLASESGLTGDNRNYTRSTDGADNVFNIRPGIDGQIGTADDIRGDDQNLHWFRIANNNPFTLDSIVDMTTYSRDLLDLPETHKFAVNADRSVGNSLGFPKTEAVMQQGSFSNEAQRELNHDDVATLLLAQSGDDLIYGTADDYTINLVYRGITNSNCDITFGFDNSRTSFASCSISAQQGKHYHITSANAYFNDGYNWHFNQKSNATIIAASITQPLPGNILQGPSQVFTIYDPDNVVFSLYIGSKPGAYDLGYYPGLKGGNSVHVTKLPTDGSNVYLTLYSLNKKTWLTNEYVYTTPIIAPPTAAYISSPADGSTLTGRQQLFKFSDPDNIVFSLYVGSKPGDYDLGYYPRLNGSNSVNVTNLPTDSSEIYLTLYSRNNGSWLTNQYQYTASAPSVVAYITSPVDGSILTSSAQVFNFSDPDNIVFSLYVGSTPGDYDLGYYPRLHGTKSVKVTNLPTDGSSVYLTLYSLDNGVWLTNEYVYNQSASAAAPNVAAFITSPANGAVLSGSKQLINFNDPDNIVFSLYVGSTPGDYDLGYYPGLNGGSTIDVINLPTDTSKIYMTLYSRLNGKWLTTEYSYTASP
jgi:hypothetical protein